MACSITPIYSAFLKQNTAVGYHQQFNKPYLDFLAISRFIISEIYSKIPYLSTDKM